MSASPGAKKKALSPKVPVNHPTIIDFVKAAITATKDRKGTSLSVIKKYIAANYKVDVEKMKSHICRIIVHATDKGVFMRSRNKGKG